MIIRTAIPGALIHPDPGTPPSLPDAATSLADPAGQAEKIAQAAATGLMTHADVDDAIVSIDGTRDAPSLEIDCLLRDNADVLRSTELVVGVMEQIEVMLDATFASAEMTVRNAA